MAVRKQQPWYKDVASLMLRDRMNFRAALSSLNISVGTEEAMAIERSAAFKKMLDQEQALLYQELATNPNFNKQMIVGGMIHTAQQLIREGEFDKAAEVWFKLARIQDWVGQSSNVNIMLGVSQADITRAKEELEKQKITVQ